MSKITIEEIKKSISQRGEGDIFVGYEETLLSSLEKEEQAHTMSVFDLNMKIAELGIALEKEKERAEKAEKECLLHKTAVDRWVPCPDHRDKVSGGCYVCRNEKLEKEVQKWQRIRTPTHGPCCTCQACGQHYDDCRCDLDEVGDELTQTKSNLQKLETEIKEGDYWQQRVKEFLSLGGCPICFATDEEGHKEKCEWGITETKLEKLVEAMEELLAYGPIFPHHIQESLEKILEEVSK